MGQLRGHSITYRITLQTLLAIKVIACIEDPVVIQRILNHLKEKGEYQNAFRLPENRGLPQTSLFG